MQVFGFVHDIYSSWFAEQTFLVIFFPSVCTVCVTLKFTVQHRFTDESAHLKSALSCLEKFVVIRY